ncbi:MAG: DUF1553 domain-containing protein [Armatimonadia bacterium]|nr:DUF1553 domain-containing protein [Armatimonadia bacterium]
MSESASILLTIFADARKVPLRHPEIRFVPWRSRADGEASSSRAGVLPLMRSVMLALTVIVTLCAVADAQAASLFEADAWSVPESGVDARVFAALEREGIAPANSCSDAVFLRRAYVDLIGTVPRPDETRVFLQDDSPDRRAALIDELLQREEFADYWALKWADLLRVKAEFPVNLWPNGVQCYHRWLRDAVKQNMPFDDFSRELLTSSGSNFRCAPVNFYRATQNREAVGLAEVVALTFMGSRIASWPEEQRDGMAQFFSRVAFKPTDEWKEEIVLNDPAPTEPLQATFPDGTTVTIEAGEDPRVVFADWLISEDNPWFARNIANRVWSWLMGRGIIHEPDDIRPDNPPVNPELLSYLEQELIASDWDLRHLFRLIANSRTYQQSPIARSDDPDAERMFACYPVRRLDAEVLIDALNWIGGTGETYQSPIPEPFTWIPEEKRAIALADGSITSTFLQMFGRPPRDTGFESERSTNVTDAQRLFMLNSSDIYHRIHDSIILRRIAIEAGGDREALIHGIYVALLSREPTVDEIADAEAYWTDSGQNANQAATDLAWALVNSMEFMYRH